MPTSIRSDLRGPQGSLAVHRYPAALAAGASHARPMPVVLLHADAGRAAQWDPVIAELPRDRDVIAFDFRGHGDSAPAADGDYGYAGRAADLAAVADAYAPGPFVLTAHSGGGGVALHYAVEHPGRVASLVLVDPASDPRALPAEVRDGYVRDLAGPGGLEALLAYYRTLAGADPAVRDRVLADAAAVHPAARAGVAAALAAWDPEPTLRAYRGPVLVLASPGTDAQRPLYRLRADLPHRVIADVGHWIQLERPAEVAAAIAGAARAAEDGAAGRAPDAGGPTP